MSKVRAALIGVGNCASALIQGVHYYKDVAYDAIVPGLMHPVIGGYHVHDIEFVTAFDVTAAKVGKDLYEAVVADPNNTIQFAKLPDELGVQVQRGPTFDGLGKYVSNVVSESAWRPVDVAAVLKNSKADVLVNYLPVGSEEATRWYAEQALMAGCAFVNCIPVFIASDTAWQKRFVEARLPIIGDDIKSQVGATITHRVLTSLFADRGIQLMQTYQLNFGGNTDFMNMLERDRLESKKISKTQAVTSMNPKIMAADDVHVGPSDYVPWLTDRKWCYIHMEGKAFGDVPLKLELKLEVWDSPNSAGIVIDAVRCAKYAMDNGISGALIPPSAYFMKSPPVQYKDEHARQLLENWLTGENF